jgi:hypothetical protein
MVSVLRQAEGRCPGALCRRLGRWLAAGADFTALDGELEAAFVHSRTPGAVA